MQSSQAEDIQHSEYTVWFSAFQEHWEGLRKVGERTQMARDLAVNENLMKVQLRNGGLKETQKKNEARPTSYQRKGASLTHTWVDSVQDRGSSLDQHEPTQSLWPWISMATTLGQGLQ